VVQKPGDWLCPACGDLNFARNEACRRCGGAKPADAGFAGGGGCGGGFGGGPPVGKPGDWMCPNCGDHNFARNMACRKCGTPKPDMGGIDPYNGQPSQGFQMKPGDWNCSQCGDLNFARNAQCRRCGAAPPAGCGGGGQFNGQPAQGLNNGNMRPGDWNCSQCGDLNFARNAQCRRCGAPPPANAGCGGGCGGYGGPNPAAFAHAKPGDWVCPACGDLNFARNVACRRCGQAKPTPEAGGGCMDGGGFQGGCGQGGGNVRPGDWFCPNCNFQCFAKFTACPRCSQPKPADAGGMAMGYQQQPMGGCGGGCGFQRQGDWSCPNCSFHCFATKDTCPRCNTPRPAEAGGQQLMALGNGMGGCGAEGAAGGMLAAAAAGMTMPMQVPPPPPPVVAGGRDRSRSPARLAAAAAAGFEGAAAAPAAAPQVVVAEEAAAPQVATVV